jgi:dTDP-glucose pyrophosphorylase
MHDIRENDPDGLLVCFHATDPRYSFAKLDTYGYVSKTAEKQAISTHASNGMYYFKHGHFFVDAAETAIAHSELHNGEFYIAPLYNHLIALGKRVRTHGTKQNWVLGTPEELATFEKTYEK